MIPVSIGKTLVDYLRLWIKQNPKLKPNVTDMDRFIEWERGQLSFDFSGLNDYYRNKYVLSGDEKFCESFCKRLEQPVTQFFKDGDLASVEVTLPVSFRYVGRHWSGEVYVNRKTNSKLKALR